MKKLKRTSLILVGALVLSALGGCGKKESNPAEAMKDKYSQYVTLSEYKGIEYTPSHTEVTHEDIHYDIESLVSQATTTEEVTSGIATMGDAVNIDYVGSVDGVEFEGGNTQGMGTQIVLGEAGYIDDFEEQIAGHEVGETFNVNVTFPDVYQNNPDLAGKNAVFVTTLNSIIVTNVPEYDDTLVATYTDYATTEEFEQAMYEKHEEEYKEYDKNVDEANVLQSLIDKSAISKYPEQEVKDMLDQSVEEIRAAADQYGIDVNTYVMYFYGFASEDDFITTLEGNIRDYLDEKIIISAVAKEENITVSKEEADAQMQRILDSYGLSDPAELEGAYTEEDYYYYALAEKVIDFLMENAAPDSDVTDAGTEAETEAE